MAFPDVGFGPLSSCTPHNFDWCYTGSTRGMRGGKHHVLQSSQSKLHCGHLPCAWETLFPPICVSELSCVTHAFGVETWTTAPKQTAQRREVDAGCQMVCAQLNVMKCHFCFLVMYAQRILRGSVEIKRPGFSRREKPPVSREPGHLRADEKEIGNSQFPLSLLLCNVERQLPRCLSPIKPCVKHYSPRVTRAGGVRLHDSRGFQASNTNATPFLNLPNPHVRPSSLALSLYSTIGDTRQQITRGC